MSGYILGGGALLLAVLLVLLSRRRTARIIDRLDAMLTQAMEGSFTGESFDESRMSSLESRLAQYLSAAQTSAVNLKSQRDQINGLISDISHQTKTPVANLKLYSQLLEEQPMNDQARDCARAISAQAEKLESLMEALVKSSRLETGILVLHPERQAIGPMLRRAVDQYMPKAEGKEIELNLTAAEGEAVFDAKWTEEAVCNLLDNGVKYTPAGGRVTVSSRDFELFSVIRISDTGPGIAEEEQTRVFSRFYRSPSVRDKEGVGLGLCLARQIAEEQGGYVKLESSPGRGCRFSLYLRRE